MKTTVANKRACRARNLISPGFKALLVLWGLGNGMSQMAHAAVSEPEPTTAVTVPSAPTQSLADKAPSSEAWAIHGQFTNVTQGHPRFRSPYSGDNSLDANGRNEETTDLTLFRGYGLEGIPNSGQTPKSTKVLE